MYFNLLSRLTSLFFTLAFLLTLGAPPPNRPTTLAALVPVAPPQIQATSLLEQESNDTIATAQAIGNTNQDWAYAISGKINTSGDLDYFSFVLNQPASHVELALTSLPADYDLFLAAAPSQSVQEGDPGLEDITILGGSISAIGGSISAIGGSISAIGGSISAIGGSISAIGGSISAIGGSISAISANAGTAAEKIDTYLWQPGTYYVAVGPANGEFSNTSGYTLNVAVTGSGMSKPTQESPTVGLHVDPGLLTAPTPEQVTTLYIINSARMGALYTPTETADVIAQLEYIAMTPPNFGARPEYGYILDIANLVEVPGELSVADMYAEWDSNPTNPLYANRVARLIDNTIKALTDTNRNGTSCPAQMPNGITCPAPLIFYENGPTVPQNSTAVFPNVEYIVLVGGDNVIPYFRIPDLTTIANEADYAAYLNALDSAGVIDPNSPQGAALRSRMALTDNPYGSNRPLRFQGFPLAVPNDAVGRLVETPANIANYLQKWQAIGTYTIEADTYNENPPYAYINGYDFLKDEAQSIELTLRNALYDTHIPVTSVINETWTRGDLETSWFNTDLTTTMGGEPPLGIFSDQFDNDPTFRHTNSLFSLNSHFDHWQIIPADDTQSTFPAQRVLEPTYDPFAAIAGGYFGGTLGYSVGCHSGYNVLDTSVLVSNQNLEAMYQADFAQALMQHAGNWIGNTGYGYGTADGIDYSERLAVLLTRELVRDQRFESSPGIFTYQGVAIGSALAQAKQHYLRNAAMLSEYDAKVLGVMTLYGLPFIHVQVNNPLPPSPEDPRQGTPGGPVPTESNAPISGSLLERTITVRLNLGPENYVTLDRTGSKVLQIALDDMTITDSFVQAGFVNPTLRIVEGNNQIGLPNIPAFVYDISALDSSGDHRLAVRDVVFERGTYAAPIPFNPQITQVVTETADPIINTNTEPNFAAGAGIWYPDKFFGFSRVGIDGDQRDQLTSFVAQFKANTDGTLGQLRNYEEMVFTIYYVDPALASPAVVNDDIAPSIHSVVIAPASSTTTSLNNTNQSDIIVLIDNGDSSSTPIAEVFALYVTNGTVWTPITLTASGTTAEGLFRYSGSIPIAPGLVRVMVGVRDEAGNVSYHTAKGAFTLWRQVYIPFIQK